MCVGRDVSRSLLPSLSMFEIPLKRSAFYREGASKKRRKWENHSSLFNHLTSWSIVQYSLLRLVCFSLSIMIFICRSRMNTSRYEILLFDVRRLLSFFLPLPLSLSRFVCLRQWLFFFIFRIYICLWSEDDGNDKGKQVSWQQQYLVCIFTERVICKLSIEFSFDNWFSNANILNQSFRFTMIHKTKRDFPGRFIWKT